MNAARRYHVIDAPLDGAAAVYASDDRDASERIAARLNKINFDLGGPWRGGRYFVDDTKPQTPSLGTLPMPQLFETLADLASSGYLFRITDNGGESADRYTAIYSDGDYIGMSASPCSPQGVGMTGEGIDLQGVQERVEAGEEIDIALGDCPEEVQRCILSTVNQGWADFLAAIETGAAHAVAPTREKAERNDGTYDSGGKGIYKAGEAFCVRLDGDNAGDDRGPYMTAREALAATLPETYSLSGPEYHSTQDDLGRLTPDPETTAKVAALAERREAAWNIERAKRNPQYFGL